MSLCLSLIGELCEACQSSPALSPPSPVCVHTLTCWHACRRPKPELRAEVVNLLLFTAEPSGGERHPDARLQVTNTHLRMRVGGELHANMLMHSCIIRCLRIYGGFIHEWSRNAEWCNQLVSDVKLLLGGATFGAKMKSKPFLKSSSTFNFLQVRAIMFYVCVCLPVSKILYILYIL